MGDISRFRAQGAVRVRPQPSPEPTAAPSPHRASCGPVLARARPVVLVLALARASTTPYSRLCLLLGSYSWHAWIRLFESTVYRLATGMQSVTVFIRHRETTSRGRARLWPRLSLLVPAFCYIPPPPTQESGSLLSANSGGVESKHGGVMVGEAVGARAPCPCGGASWSCVVLERGDLTVR